MNPKWLCIFRSGVTPPEPYSRPEVVACAPADDEAAILALEYGQSHVDEDEDIWVRVA